MIFSTVFGQIVTAVVPPNTFISPYYFPLLIHNPNSGTLLCFEYVRRGRGWLGAGAAAQ